MSKKTKAGWGYSKEQVKIDITQKTENKTNFWEQQVEGLIVIPDIDDEANELENAKVQQAPSMINNQIQDFRQLQQESRSYSLPPPKDNIDLSSLIYAIRPYEELNEEDEQWEFQNLKTQIYEIVSSMYNTNISDENE